MVEILFQTNDQTSPEVLNEGLLIKLLEEAGLKIRSSARNELMRILGEHFQEQGSIPLNADHIVWVAKDFASDHQPVESTVVNVCQKTVKSQRRVVRDRKVESSGDRDSCEYTL